MKRKDFHVGTSTQGVHTRQAVEEDPWTVKLTTTTFDFRRWRNRMGTDVPAGRDELLKTLATSLRRVSSIRSPKTIEVIFRSSLPALFEFLDTSSSSVSGVERITDVSYALLNEFLLWLNVRPARTATGRLACSSARSIYTGIRTVLSQCVQAGQLSIDCVPRGAFSGVARSYRPPPPYSKHEMQGLMAALGQDLRKVKAGGFDGTEADRLFIYFLLIAVRTGRNPTALYEMERGAIHPHPLKPDTHSLLTTYKRRGNTTSTQSMRRPRLVEQMSMLNADTSGLIRDVLEFTGDLVQEAPEAIKNRVWLCRRLKRADLGPVGLFSIHMFIYYAERFVMRHHLIADAESVQSTSALPLHITIMRLRKTFASRMWELTGGDIVATANLLGNQPHVTDTHYLAVTPDMVRNHHFLGKCLEIDLRGNNDDPKVMGRLAKEMRIDVCEVKKILNGGNNTGVGRCSSPFQGRFAPKDGKTACTAFLHCFRCPNQIIMESDLYRLYSFYWLLVKERSLLGRNQWHKVYGWVVREIDSVVALHFSPRSIREAKAKAHATPHPMWRDRSILLGS